MDLTPFIVSIPDRENEYSYCMTKDCVSAAARIISSMDPNIDPCDNFYGFTCGGFIDNTEIPPEKFGVSTMSQIQVIIVAAVFSITGS